MKTAILGYILGIYRVNGKDNGNHYSIIGYILGIYGDNGEECFFSGQSLRTRPWKIKHGGLPAPSSGYRTHEASETPMIVTNMPMQVPLG